MSKLEDETVEIIQLKQQRDNRLKIYEKNLRYLQNYNKRLNIVSLEPPEREEKEGETEKNIPKMAENSQTGQIPYRNKKVSKSTVDSQQDII